MSKITTAITWMAGITLLYYFAGILAGTPNTALLNLVLNPEQWQQSQAWLKIIGVTTLTVGVLSALLARGLNSDLFVMVPIITLLFNFGWDFLVIYQKMAESGGPGEVFAILMLGPIFLFYVFSVIEWWRNPT